MHGSSGIPGLPCLLVQILCRIFNAVCCGAILLDRNKAPVHVSERAERFLEAGLTCKHGRLCASDRGSDLRLQTTLDQSLEYGNAETSWGREAIPLQRAGNRPIIARVLAIEGEVQAQLDGAALIVLLIDPEDCPKPSAAILKQVFDLTRSEARVANELLGGRTVDEIASDAGVSSATVRSQVKAIFAKTETNRQAELVGLLTRLALISESDSNHEILT